MSYPVVNVISGIQLNGMGMDSRNAKLSWFLTEQKTWILLSQFGFVYPEKAQED